MNLLHLTIKTSPKSIDLMQNTSPLFNNPFLSPCNYVIENKDIFNIDFRKLSILSKIWEWCI